MRVIEQASGENWHLYHGDCCEVLRGLPDDSLHFSIFSPPFASLYVYSDSERDMGNSESDDEFFFALRLLGRVVDPKDYARAACQRALHEPAKHDHAQRIHRDSRFSR